MRYSPGFTEKIQVVNRKPVKVTLSKDNTILSKKFKWRNLKKKSVKAAEKKNKELQKDVTTKTFIENKSKIGETKLYYEQLRDMTGKR